MRKNNYQVSKVAVALLLTILASACTADSAMDGGEPLPQGKYPLEFTSQMYGMEVTRATSAGTWEGDEEIALKVAGSDTRKYTVSDKNTGKITAASDATPFYWTSTTESKDVSAYYPYTLALASTITVKEDQSNAANYQASDALYAPTTSIAFTASEKKLTFNHLPAKVVANLNAGDGVTDLEVQGSTVKFVSQNLSAPFDNATGVVTAAQPGSSSVSSNMLATPAGEFDKSVQALLVPCQMKDNKFIEVTIGSDVFNYIPLTDTDGKLESGKVCTYEITVKRDGIEVELTESGEWTGGVNDNIVSLPLMAFTIDLTSYSTDKTYTLPFYHLGETGTNYTLVVDWGDGSTRTTILPETDLSTAILHNYTDAKEYTITITTTEQNYSNQQIPNFKPGYFRTGNNNPKKLKSFDTPLLNMGKLSNLFEECSNLTSIPKELFVNNLQVTSVQYCFNHCNNLKEIPAGLFDKNTLVTNFQDCFVGCTSLTNIPEDLFAKNLPAETFTDCFQFCSGLTSIPKKLFANNTAAKEFDNCFAYCTTLTEIPAELFKYNVNVTDFSICFDHCSNLTSIPELLFATNTKAVTFATCFLSCTKLVLNKNIFCDEDTQKTTRFAEVDVNFTSCFENAGSDASVSNAGTAPALWDYTYASSPLPNNKTAECFKGIGSVTNAADIPDAWKIKQP